MIQVAVGFLLWGGLHAGAAQGLAIWLQKPLKR
jgi:hypothetical protein